MESNASLDMIKAVYEDGCATINGRDYKLLNMTHKKRLKVFAFSTKIQSDGDLGFLGSDEWEAVEAIINQHVTYNGDTLDKLPKHFDEYPEDYIQYAIAMTGAMSYPFFKGKLTA